MTCPHCGEEMQLEQVFCEHCGKERLLVPVYEPEIEESVAESMNNIIDVLGSDSLKDNHTDLKEETDLLEEIKKDSLSSGRHNMKQLKFMLFSIISLVIVISVFSVCFYFYSDNSYDFHYDKAIEAYNSENWEEALYQAELCLQDSPDNLELLVLKLHIYEQLDDYDQRLNVARMILSIDETNDEANEIVIYDYIKNEDYIELSKYLETCANDSVKQKYTEYLASFPEYSEEPGAYETSISLKLFSAGKGDIYYTLDGSEPSKYSDRYTGPIKLTDGEYIVSSVYINEFGVSSDIVTKVYEVNVSVDFLPEVMPQDGEYSYPEVIWVNIPSEEYTVYYTTDGSDPDLDSSIYSEPFPMPLGNSIYKFIMTNEEGNASDVLTYEYKCNPKLNLDIEQAIFSLKQNLTAHGEIFDYIGANPEDAIHKTYQCDGMITKDEIVYYHITEYMKTESGDITNTGNKYAVSVIDGSSHRVNITSNGIVSFADL